MGIDDEAAKWPFQSLFFWNSRPDFAELCPVPAPLHGFNPCFSGTRARTSSNENHLMKNGTFQSLFFWNSRPDARSPAILSISLQFQSLFFWNSRPDTLKDGSTTYPAVEFQSLFFWNSRPDYTIRYSAFTDPMFQSLFFWNSRPDSSITSMKLQNKLVSILVFLELAPGPRKKQVLCRWCD